jgi:hypothetical protein
MDSDLRALVQPFLKMYPFEDYIIIDQQIISESLSHFRAYYRRTNTLVAIEKHQTLRISRSYERLRALIFAL